MNRRKILEHYDKGAVHKLGEGESSGQSQPFQYLYFPQSSSHIIVSFYTVCFTHWKREKHYSSEIVFCEKKRTKNQKQQG